MWSRCEFCRKRFICCFLTVAWLLGGLAADGLADGAYKWTWEHGSDTRNANGVYGTQGVADPANQPGARSRGATWTTSDGRLWLFGGWGRDGTGATGVLNDLWCYEAGAWTWVAGSATVNAWASPVNGPGGCENPVVWVAGADHLYLYGGKGYDLVGGYGYLSDVWRFDGSSWAQLRGPGTVNGNGTLGTMNVFAAANEPRARSGVQPWYTGGNSVYIFGGDTNGGSALCSDVWEYSIFLNQWRWIGGLLPWDQSSVGNSNTCVFNPSHFPGSRYSGQTWLGAPDRLLLFGGYGYDETNGPGYIGDLWEFDLGVMQWRCKGGVGVVADSGVYGTVGQAGSRPGTRMRGATWHTGDNELLLFGGYEASGGVMRNDLMSFVETSCPVDWTWEGGPSVPDQYGIYGTRGVPAPTNWPGARYGAMTWATDDGRLWLFGGFGRSASDYGVLNDLWAAVTGDVYVTVTTTPYLLDVSWDSAPYAAPHVAITTLGSVHTIGTQARQVRSDSVFSFVSWSDGGAVEHDVTIVGADPTFTATFGLSFNYAVIESIMDVPGDQGGWARIHFSRSGFDVIAETQYPISRYDVHRRVDDPAKAARLLATRGPDKTAPPGVWEVVGSVSAQQEDDYLVLVPTLGDSAATTIWSVYHVSAHTTTPSVFYHSPPDSGYSVDNIAPGVPQQILAAYAADGVTLDWDDAPEPDFQYYRVYRGTGPGFVPSPTNLVQETAASDWTDPSTDPWAYHYKVTTLDHAGNESVAGAPMSVSGAGGGTVPARTRLLDAAPNPFNPSTWLSFELAAGGQARLEIFDVAGRRVTTLVDGHREPGRHRVAWAGRDAAGRLVGSGVYFYRLTAADYSATARMLLMK